jgi:hypothetical protein
LGLTEVVLVESGLSEESSIPVAEEIRHMSDEFLKIEMAGAVMDVPYRRAVSLLSRGLAVIATTDLVADDPAPATTEVPQDAEGDLSDDQDDDLIGEKPAKRSRRPKKDLSAPAPWGQEGDYAENKPLQDE